MQGPLAYPFYDPRFDGQLALKNSPDQESSTLEMSGGFPVELAWAPISVAPSAIWTQGQSPQQRRQTLCAINGSLIFLPHFSSWHWPFRECERSGTIAKGNRWPWQAAGRSLITLFCFPRPSVRRMRTCSGMSCMPSWGSWWTCVFSPPLSLRYWILFSLP